MIIVSLTSYPKRIKLVPIALKSFMQDQTLKADKYILWLSVHEFNVEKTPRELGLEDLVDAGLEIKWANEDSKIHLRHNSCILWPNDINIMIDEDIFYPPSYTEELVNASKKYPNSVISYFACFEIFTGKRKYELPRIPWPSLRNKFSGGLVCFPPNTFPAICFKYVLLRNKVCPFHDEIWVNIFLKYTRTKVYGLHNIDWKIFKTILPEDEIENLHDKHKIIEGKYSFDTRQFNQVLLTFPELKKVYKRCTFGLYSFTDKDEIEKCKKEFGVVEVI